MDQQSLEIDMVAVSRVARRVNLKELRLTETSAKTFPGPSGPLEAELDYKNVVLKLEPNLIEIQSTVDFRAKCNGIKTAEMRAVYLLVYSIGGTEPVAETDAKHFALANGAYHSWPFVRELIYSMTSRMGLPPFVLPVLTFTPPKPKQAGPPATVHSVVSKVGGPTKATAAEGRRARC